MHTVLFFFPRNNIQVSQSALRKTLFPPESSSENEVDSETSMRGFITVIPTLQTDFSQAWEVRLAGGPYKNEGRLEIRPSGGDWGTVCNRQDSSKLNEFCYLPDDEDVCRRLGYPGIYAFSLAGQRFGSTNGPIWSQGMHCSGSGNRSKQCSFAEWSLRDTSCDHSFDVAVLCITGKVFTIKTANSKVIQEKNILFWTYASMVELNIYPFSMNVQWSIPWFK